MLSPAVTSPLVPSSKSGCEAEPPMGLRFARTAIPVLAGEVPGVRVAVRRVGLPVKTLAGEAFAVRARAMGPVGEQGAAVEEVLRGFGTVAVKSTPLFWVSAQTLVRTAAVVFESRGPAVPRKQLGPLAPPKPT